MTSIHEQPPRPETSQLPAALRKLKAQWNKNAFVSIGLDSEASKLPERVRSGWPDRAMVEFNSNIINETYDTANAFKVNAAFYEAEALGWGALKSTMLYIKDVAPNVLRILDAKRADIGNTNRGYAGMAFGHMQADALTVAPYMGGSFIKDGERKLGSLEPFFNEKDKLIFVLCRTSNDDAGDLQDLPVPIKKLPKRYKEKFGNLDDLADMIEAFGIQSELKKIGGYEKGTVPLYLVLAHKLAREWNINGNLGLVVGATYPQELKWIRQIVGNLPILIPGIGAQAGEAEAAVRAGLDSNNEGIIVNASRSVIFASSGNDYAQAAKQEAVRLGNQINQYRLAA